MTYQECVDYVLSIPLFAAKLGTENLNKILDLMNHPEKSYNVIHVAGTNGKGSTCLFLESILKRAGFRVGVFTSPHLVCINERIRMNDLVISNDDFVSTFEETMQYVSLAKEQGIAHPSFFEFVFLMAAIYFEKQKPDYVIFETGMGGRLDATNVVSPVLTMITSIGLDHMQFLGNTIEEIAAEKAGIIKPHVPVVFFARDERATNVITQYANKCGADLYCVEKKQYKLKKFTEKTIDFSFESGYYRYCSLQIKKTALYQVENAILAVKAFELLMNTMNSLGTNSGANIDIDCIQDGLLSMTWPGRMQEIAPNIYIDGAHNEEAIGAFCETLEELFCEKKKSLLFAVSKDKNYEKMIERICDLTFEEIVIVRYEGDRAADVSAVEDTFRHFSGSRIVTFEDIRTGFSYAKSHVGDSLLFCVGSLYLAGDLLSLGV